MKLPMYRPGSLRFFHFDDGGVGAIITSCFLSALVGALFFYAYRIDPKISPATGGFIRVLANFICLLPPLLHLGGLPRVRPWKRNHSLWLWAFFGTLTTSLYFLAVPMIGSGLTMFLNAGGGILIVALSPYLAGQKASSCHWVGAIGSFLGLYLLTYHAPRGVSGIGILVATLSGLFGGLAMLMLAKSKKDYQPETVMFHWTLVNLVAYSGFFFFAPPVFPTLPGAWLALVLAGLGAALAQYLTALAYQQSSAAFIACLSYLSPVLSLLLDAWIFGISLTRLSLMGALLVLFFGVGLPLLGGKGGHGRFAR